jgi:hypothetical protein
MFGRAHLWHAMFDRCFFLDKKGVIVRTIAQLQPNRVAWCWQATSVVETAAFTKERTEAMKLALIRAFSLDQLS